MEYKLNKNESYKDYCIRLYRNKDLYGLKNDVIGFLINEAFPDMKKDESAHRKSTIKYIEGFDEGYEKGLLEVEVDSNSKGLKTLIPKTHLERYKDLVGEYNIKKKDMQIERNKLAKMARTVTPSILLAEQYSIFLKNKVDIPKFEYKNIDSNKGTVLKVILADWHIGVDIDEEYNKYNKQIAINRVDKLILHIINLTEREKPEYISITHLGDIIEGINMRPNQMFDVEFTLSEQIIFAQELLFRIVFTLSEYCEIRIGGIRGNHDRITGNKHMAISKDNAIYVIMENLKNFIKLSETYNGKSRINIIDSKDYGSYANEIINGKLLRYTHGDNDSKLSDTKFPKYNSTDNENYDILVFGHLHHYREIARNRNEIELYTGSLCGANEYSKTKIKSIADAGQTIIIFRGEDIIPYNVNLQ